MFPCLHYCNKTILTTHLSDFILRYLLTYDAVTFHSFLESILTSNSVDQSKGRSITASRHHQSPWLFLDAANTLFHTAKRRAYIPAPKKKRNRPAGANGVDSQASQDDEEEDDGEEEALREVERGEDLRTAAGNSPWPPGVVPVLEELPKWGLLASVLDEIEESITVQNEVDLSESACLSSPHQVLALTSFLVPLPSHQCNKHSTYHGFN